TNAVGNESTNKQSNDPTHELSNAARIATKNNLHQAAHPSPAILNRVGALLANPGLGELKLYLIWKTLGLRKSAPSLFAQGSYSPLQITGDKADHVLAFTRQHENQTIIWVAPRLCFSLIAGAAIGEAADTLAPDTPATNTMWNNSEEKGSSWGNTSLDLTSLNPTSLGVTRPDLARLGHSRCYHNIFTGECLSLVPDADRQPLLANLLARFPVALLVNQAS
ncbi:MAG: hypothetical protein WAL41_03605, partial [Mycobacterium sp.]